MHARSTACTPDVKLIEARQLPLDPVAQAAACLLLNNLNLDPKPYQSLSLKQP